MESNKSNISNISNVYMSHHSYDCEPPIHSVLVVYKDGQREYIGEMSEDDIWAKYGQFLSESHWDRMLDEAQGVFGLFDEPPEKPSLFNGIKSPDPEFS
jgi:hypothetical protein